VSLLQGSYLRQELDHLAMQSYMTTDVLSRAVEALQVQALALTAGEDERVCGRKASGPRVGDAATSSK
jgi:hypothetical protein